MRPDITFVNNDNAPDPVGKSRGPAFQNIVFKEAFRERRARFSQGITWLRFLPAIKPSQYRWMMPVDIYRDMAGTQLCSPSALDSNAPNCFEVALNWLRRNKRQLLASKEHNPNGFRLYPSRYGIAWGIEADAPEGERLKLFFASLYDGSRGGTTGLAYNILRDADEQDNEPGSQTLGQRIHGDITAPDSGRLVKIERNLAEKSEYANYKSSIGKHPAPVKQALAVITEAEYSLLRPLENTIHIPDETESHSILRRYLGDAIYGEIFGAPTTTGWEPPSEQPAEAAAAPTPADGASASSGTREEAPKGETTQVEAPEKPAPKTEGAEGGEAYKTREVTALISSGPEGIKTLLANKSRLSKALLEIVLDEAKGYNISE